MVKAVKGSYRQRKEFYTAIGHFVVAWANLEATLDHNLISLHMISEDAAKQLRHELPEKIGKLRSYIGKWDRFKSSVDALNTVFNEITTLAKTRNDYIHNSVRRFAASGEAETIRYITPRSSKPWAKKMVSTDDIRLAADRVKHLDELLKTIIVLMFVELGTSHHKWASDHLCYEAQLLDAERQMREAEQADQGSPSV
jgi:hypothetical protein